MTTADSPESAQLDRLTRCVEWVNNTGKAWLSGVHIPQPSSELAADDRVTPIKLSIVTDNLIKMGVDHLRWITADLADNREVRMFAAFTALRSALLGVSHAAWVLQPDDPQLRIQRLVELCWTDRQEERAALNSFTNGRLTPDQAETHAKALEPVDTAIAELSDISSTLGLTLDRRDRVKATDVITTVAKSLDDETRWLNRGVQWVWRTGSATAHCYPWVMKYSGTSSGFDEQRFHSAVQSCVLIASHAMDLHHARSRTSQGH